jgi:hypothetical protein
LKPKRLLVVLKTTDGAQMEDRANPVLVLITAVLIAAVTIVYIANRSMDPYSYHYSLSPAAILHTASWHS